MTQRRPSRFGMRLLTALATSAVAIVTVAMLATAGSAQSGERTLVLNETSKGSLFQFVDQPPLTTQRRKAISIGDELIFANALIDVAKRPAGMIETVCTAVKPAHSIDSGAAFSCAGVAHLADGDLFFAARFSPTHGPSTVHGALTGGTKAFEGVRGTFTTIGQPSTDTFHILP